MVRLYDVNDGSITLNGLNVRCHIGSRVSHLPSLCICITEMELRKSLQRGMCWVCRQGAEAGFASRQCCCGSSGHCEDLPPLHIITFSSTEPPLFICLLGTIPVDVHSSKTGCSSGACSGFGVCVTSGSPVTGAVQRHHLQKYCLWQVHVNFYALSCILICEP